MSESNRPSFVGQYWLLPMRGFSYKSLPPNDLASDANLKDPNEWLRLLCVLERAKRGDFSELARLPSIISASADETIIECGLRLMAHAGSKSLRKGLSRFYSHPNSITRSAALDAVRFTCDLGLVDPLLEFLRSAGDSDRLLVMSVLSGLLEAEPATLYDDADTMAPDAYEKLVQHRAGGLRKRFGDSAAILNGKLFDLWHVLNRLESLCRDDDAFALSGLTSIYINYFEAFTGTACVGLFDSELTAQTPSILAVVERFRYNSRPEDFEPGQRYFFGHPVTD